MTSCVVCTNAQDRKRVVFENEHWIVYHANETNIPGYVVVVPRRHFLDLSHATEAETRSYGQVLSQAMSAMRNVVECERIYTFSLGESVPHYHLHVMPRRAEFPRAYRGRGIMQYPLVPVLDDNILQLTCERLRRAFARVVAIT